MSHRTVAIAGAALLALSGCTVATHAPTAEPPVSADVPRAAPVPVDPVEQYATDRLRTMSLDEKIRSMLMLHLPGLDTVHLGALARAEGLGGLILMGDNVPDPPDGLAALTPALSAEADLPVLVAIDQEGGVVRRIGSDAAPAASDLRFLDPSATTAAFADRARLLDSLGVSVNFGIVADVSADPSSFIFERSFGGTASEASERVEAAVVGEQGLVLSTLKHFPGHGVSPADSHVGIPTTTMGIDQWREGHAPPFVAGIATGASIVMMGHLQFDVIDPQPASLSAGWIDLLRTELGFDGIVITDDLSMLEASGRDDLRDPATNAIRAVAAGNTMLLYVGPVDVATIVTAIRTAVLDGRIDEALIDDAAHRVLEVRRLLSGETGRFPHCSERCLDMIE